MQQYVVERFATIFGCFDKHFQILHHLLLTTEVVERQRAERVLEFLLARRKLFLSDIKIFVHVCKGTDFFCIFAA